MHIKILDMLLYYFYITINNILLYIVSSKEYNIMLIHNTDYLLVILLL